MIPLVPGLPREQSDPAFGRVPPLVLLADEDTRVMELLAFAFKANHFRVTIAHEGEEALRRAQSERPDLVIADVRLPGRGGLELCSILRRDSEHGDVPVILLSPASDSDSRIEALAHGADTLIGKPFSPRELVACAQRLVMRSRDAARHARRSAELERELSRAQNDARRCRDEAERERALRTLAAGMLGELLRSPDLEELDARLLRETCRQTGARSAALLAADGHGSLVPVAVRGDLRERWEGLALAETGTCAEWLRTVNAPLRREDLERLPDPPGEIAALAAHGVALIAPVHAPGGALEALLVCEDRADGSAFRAEDRDRLAALCTAASPARATARRFREQQDRALALLGSRSSNDPRRRGAATEARVRIAAVAATLGMAGVDLARLEQAVDLGPWAWSDAGRTALAMLAEGDAGTHVRRLCRLLAGAEACATGEAGAGEDVPVLLTAAGLRYQALRLAGRSTFEAWRTAIAWLGLATDPLLRQGFPEAAEQF